MIKNIKMKPKLITLFLLVGIIPLALVGWIASSVAGKALMKKSFDGLEAVREIKKNQIEGFFKERLGDVEVLANNPFVLQAFKDLDNAFRVGETVVPVGSGDIPKSATMPPSLTGLFMINISLHLNTIWKPMDTMIYS